MQRIIARKQRGFTLPDILIGIVISIAFILAALQLLIYAYQVETSTREAIAASNSARQVVENMRGIKQAPPLLGISANASIYGSIPQLAPLKSATANVLINPSYSGTRKVVVTVNWISAVKNRAKTWKLVTILSTEGEGIL
ncbi:MAG: hypothetical protein QM758_18950 [Armatimonas sp.]